MNDIRAVFFAYDVCVVIDPMLGGDDIGKQRSIVVGQCFEAFKLQENGMGHGQVSRAATSFRPGLDAHLGDETAYFTILSCATDADLEIAKLATARMEGDECRYLHYA